jgi:hypothetical protein
MLCAVSHSPLSCEFGTFSTSAGRAENSSVALRLDQIETEP